MKNIRKGYRLTDEEEAIMRGEIPAEGDKPQEDLQNELPGKQKTLSGKAIKAIVPLLIVLIMMIGIAYFFVYLIGGGKSDKDSLVSDSFYFSLRQEFIHDPFPPLSENERAVFIQKLALTPQEEELFWPEFYLFANQFEQAEAVHRKWIDLVNEKGEKITDPDLAVKIYLSINKRHTFLIKQYSDIFSKVLSTERMPWVFILFDQLTVDRNIENQ